MPITNTTAVSSSNTLGVSYLPSLLAQPTQRTPEILLLAARAAAGWQGWSTVTKLLAGEAWLDHESFGHGRALLARAAVELGDPTAALMAVLAMRGAVSGCDRAWRQVTLARALDRAELLDSAATIYLAAAEGVPEIADWLRLRAAGITADSSTRMALYGLVTRPAARLRIRWTEALARDRTGDPVALPPVLTKSSCSVYTMKHECDRLSSFSWH